MEYPYSNVPIISITSPETFFLTLCVMAIVLGGIYIFSMSVYALWLEIMKLIRRMKT